MTTYHFAETLVWPIGAGGAVKLARNQRVTVTNPATSLPPTGLAQGGVPVTGGIVVSDADGKLEFETTDVDLVDLTADGGFEKRIEAQELLGIEGSGGGATDAGVATQISTGSNTQSAGDKRWERGVNVKRYGAVGDGVTDDSTAILNALAANQGKSVYFPAGTYLIASSTRVALTANFTSLVGDGPLLSKLKFTHASGGLDIGDGTNNIYQNVLKDIAFIGNAAATTLLVRCRKMYEPVLQNVSAEQASAVIIELNECGQLDADVLRLQQAPIGIKITGTVTPIANIRLANFFDMDEAIRLASTGVARLALHDSWIEACPDVVTVNSPATAVSIGELIYNKVRVLAATGNQKLYRHVAASSVNNQRIVVDAYVQASASTTPLIDLTAFANIGDMRFAIDRLNAIIAGTGPLIATHASQDWFRVRTSFREVWSATGTFDTARWSATPYATGGTWPDPFRLSGTGTPEGAVAAPPGSTFQRIEGGSTALYVKTSGTGTTGWAAAVAGDVLEAPVTARSTDAIADDFGVNIWQAQRSFSEGTNPGAVVAGINGAGQMRATGSFGSFLADNGTTLVSYAATGASVTTGTDFNLHAKAATNKVQIGTGMLGLSTYSTAGRPTALQGAACIIYDTTLNMPIWSDGTNWRDFYTGANV